MQQKPVLTLDDARRIAAAAHAHALANEWNVVITIVDEGANLLYLERMDNTQIGSVQVSIEKARTAALFRRPSQLFEAAVSGGRTVMLGLPGAVPIEGGVPLLHQGQLVGAIGVSGVQSAQDGLIAQAGAAALL